MREVSRGRRKRKIFCFDVLCVINAYYFDDADQQYHHYDDFISPSSNWFVGKVKKLFGVKDVHDLKAQSLMQYLQCYSTASSQPSDLRALLCRDVSAAVEDITCKFTHVKDGYSYRYHHQRNESSKVLSVRACL